MTGPEDAELNAILEKRHAASDPRFARAATRNRETGTRVPDQPMRAGSDDRRCQEGLWLGNLDSLCHM